MKPEIGDLVRDKQKKKLMIVIEKFNAPGFYWLFGSKDFGIFYYNMFLVVSKITE